MADRQYQTDIMNETRGHMRNGVKRVLIVSPTGSGKTVLGAKMLGGAAARGKRVWWLVHRKELLDKASETFSDLGIDHSIIAGGAEGNRYSKIQVASVQTLLGRIGQIPAPDLICTDEAHHCVAYTWETILGAYPMAYNVGLTATPQRPDGRGLGKWYEKIVLGPAPAWLIENGYLAKYRIFAPPTEMSTAGVKVVDGDYNQTLLAKAVDRPKLVGDIVSHYSQLGAGKRAIVFAVNIEHSKHIVEAFSAAGYRAAHVDGDTRNGGARNRRTAFRDFETGQIDILSNVDLFGEGVDIPGIQMAILARPTKSLSVYLQQVGRCLRPKPDGSSAIILDHAGNCHQDGFGMPDADREWSLEDHPKSNKKSAVVSVKTCPKCFGVLSSSVRTCECGHVFVVTAAIPKTADGQLEEVNAAMAAEDKRNQRLREEYSRRSLIEMVELGARRGYRFPEAWAARRWEQVSSKRRSHVAA